MEKESAKSPFKIDKKFNFPICFAGNFDIIFNYLL